MEIDWVLSGISLYLRQIGFKWGQSKNSLTVVL